MSQNYIHQSKTFYKNLLRRLKNKWMAAPVTGLLAAIGIAANFATPVQAAPFTPACEPHGYLFQYFNDGNANQPPTHTYPIDLVTNSIGTTTDIQNTTVNAVGYNVLNDYIYGWNNQNPPNTQLVRIHGDFTAEPITTVTGLPSGIGIIAAGDVDANGQYWFFNPTQWQRIDLTGNPPTYEGSGSIYNAAGPPAGLPTGASEVIDVAYVPPTFVNDNRGGLYTIVNHSGAPQLYRMDISTPTSPTWEYIGSLAPSMSTADGIAGALYADKLGVLYAGSNNGKLWRIVIGNSGIGIDTTAYKLGSTGNAVNGNDGVRCANALLPMDFGDAPSSYLTKWEEVGPLHLIGNFNESASTSELMLGDKIDMEKAGDGLPSDGANGDDLNHQPLPYINDEDSVQHIVAPPTPVDLKVPIVVTNTSSKPATLVGWIDSDGDGSFMDEQKVTRDIPVNAGRITRELTFPGLDISDNTYARFRVFEGTGLSDDQLQPAGFDSSFQVGEVEDYLVQVGSFSVNKTADPPEGSAVSPGENLTYTLDITNTGTTDLVDLTVHDDLTDVLDDATLEGMPSVDPSSAGTATATGAKLEFKGDVATGQTVRVTYTVKVKPADQIENSTMQNYVIAAHSNCHPTVHDNGSISVDHADCNTTHGVEGLADTGSNLVLTMIISGGLLAASTAAFIIIRRLPHSASI